MAGELLQIVVFFVCRAVGTDNAELAAACFHFVELPRHGEQRLRPGDRLQLSVNAHQRRLQALRILSEVEGIAAFDAEELAVDAGTVAVVPANDFVVAYAESGFAAVRTVSANGADVVHFPRAGLVTVRAAGERAHGTDIDAGAAFVAVQMIAIVGGDLGNDSAIHDAQRADAHAFITHAHAAVAEDAARGVVKHHRRPLLLIHVQLGFGVAAFARAVAEDHVLQFALAAFIADRAIERMVGEQQFQHGFAGLRDKRRIRSHHHAFADRNGAGGLQFRCLLNFHKAHAAGGLQ